MKAAKLISLALFIAVLCFGQSKQASFYVSTGGSDGAATVTIDSTDTSRVYIVFPDDAGYWTVTTTLPTSNYATRQQTRPKNWDCYGDCWLYIYPDSASGSGVEIDSLALKLMPLIWDETNSVFTVDATHCRYLKLDDQTDFYDNSIYYSAWTSGTGVGCLLTGLLWPVSGFAIDVIQVSYGGGTGTYDLQPFFTRSRR